MKRSAIAIGLCLAVIIAGGCSPAADDDTTGTTATADDATEVGTDQDAGDDTASDEDTDTADEDTDGDTDAEDAEVVEGGTFNMALSVDPGNLDPHVSASAALLQLTQLAYDPLLSLDPDSGEIQSGLATGWEVDGTEVELTLAEDVTCADGTPFTAGDAAANLNHVADPENQSPFLGVYVPAGITASGDDATSTVTMELAAPAPFVLHGLAVLPMVCRPGLEDRESLQDQTSGTGPYVLTEAVPDDHYTYTVREGYTWGPDGASTDTPGMPETITMRIISNETTAVNLLLSGELNATRVLGSDAARLEAADMFVSPTTALIGQMWFNHSEGRPTAESDVRVALVHALDLEQLRAVLTSDRGAPPSAFAISDPVACPGESVPDALPAHDPELAAQMLDDAGWTLNDDGMRERDGQPLTLDLLIPSDLGSPGSSAGELAVQQWQEIGVDATSTTQNSTAVQEVVFGAGDWDATWLSLNVSSPDQLVPFMSGPAAPEGTNFAAISNDAYEAGVAEASELPPEEGCEVWLDAEANLVRDADVVPFANEVVPTFGQGATFETAGQIIPTTIRMTAS